MARILVLEDDRILAQTIISILESEGHHVSLATTGPQVLEYTFDSKYDLYLFDVNVPLLNVQKSFGEWTSYWGGGYVINEAEGQKNYAFGGAQIQKDIGKKWSLGGEIFIPIPIKS